MNSFLVIAIFILFVFLMISKRLPTLVALPSMAILIAISLGISFNDILNDIIGLGSFRLYAAIITTIFGAVFAEVIHKTGISTNIIRSASEFCGDNPVVLSLILTFATALIFTSVSGLGAVIMVGTIVIPMLISVGISPIVSSVLVILGLNLGGLFNISNYTFYSQVLNVHVTYVRNCSFILGVTNSIMIILYAILNVKRSKSMFHCSVPKNSPYTKVRFYALLTPIVPIILTFIWPLIFKANINILSAILLGILYGILTTCPKRILDVFTKSFLDGIVSAASAIALMISLGILLQSVTNEQVSNIISPLIIKLIPSHKITYILIFLLCSPFALFRGPFNLFGLGSGIVSLMLMTNTLNPLAILGAIMSIGAVQGICDPTNTHNVWIANYSGVDTSRILKKSLPYVMLQVLINLIIMSIFFV